MCKDKLRKCIRKALNKLHCMYRVAKVTIEFQQLNYRIPGFPEVDVLPQNPIKRCEKVRRKQVSTRGVLRSSPATSIHSLQASTDLANRTIGWWKSGTCLTDRSQRIKNERRRAE